MRGLIGLIAVIVVGFASTSCPVSLAAEGQTSRPSEAGKILQATGVTSGLIVHLGCGDGRLTAALKSGDGFLVHGLDVDAGNVEAARQHIRSLGLYGRVSVAHFDGKRLPYVDNLVNLLVAENLGQVRMDEVMRVLAPRGAAYVKSDGQWIKTVKPWPDEIDEWTHWLHSADGNPVAHDARVGLPRRFQWSATPRWSRDHEKSPSLTGMVTARGRLFMILDEAPASIAGPLPDKWSLVARDAFNGVLLWKKPVTDWGWQAWSPKEPMNRRWGNPRFIHRRLVAVGDRVYVTLGYSAPVTALDAATGKTVRVYKGTENTAEILHEGGTLYLSVATGPKDAIDRAPPHRVMAVDTEDGRVLWQAGPFPSLLDVTERGKQRVLKQGRLMLAVGAGRAICVTEEQLVALDARDGKQVWSVPRPPLVFGKKPADEKALKAARARGVFNLGALMIHDGRVYFSQTHIPARGSKFSDQTGMTVLCLDADSGKELWRGEHGGWGYTTNLNVYGVADSVWVHAAPGGEGGRKNGRLLGLDPATGAVKRTLSVLPAVQTSHHHRCYRNKATDRFLLMGKEGVEYVDWEEGTVTLHRWLRGMCLYGILPANGLLYVPPHACDCSTMCELNGYFALAADSDAPNTPDPVAQRLEKGPAFEEIRIAKSEARNQDDWPIHRRDTFRSCAGGAIGSALKPRWSASVGGQLTAASIAGGRVYLSRQDAHEVLALDEVQGDVLWRFTTGGIVDSAPTYDDGRLLFGCADGWVYCLRADDGMLAWRFRAAPHARFAIDDDRLQSVWPVHGSVIVHAGTAYVVAGRSSYLDGGLYLYALDPDTGRCKQQARYHTVQDDQMDMEEGVINDLLVRGGDELFLRHMEIQTEPLALAPTKSWGFAGPNPAPKSSAYLNSGQGFLDDTLFGRPRFRLEGDEDGHRLVFNDKCTFTMQLSLYSTKDVFFHPGREGYPVICRDRSGPKGVLGDRRRRNLTAKNAKPQDERNVLWKQRVPVRIFAMALAGDTLLLGGAPDVVDPDDTWAAFEGRKGGRLWTVSTADGRKQTELRLDSPPVWDGIAVANGRVFLTLADGKVVCLDTQ